MDKQMGKKQLAGARRSNSFSDILREGASLLGNSPAGPGGTARMATGPISGALGGAAAGMAARRLRRVKQDKPSY